MNRVLIQTVVLGVLTSPLLTPLSACMMLQDGYAGRISQNRHQAILIHQGDRQELILRVNYKITGAKLPSQFAWIITTPSEPTHFRVASSDSFHKIAPWARRALAPPKPKSLTRSLLQDDVAEGSVEPPLIFGKPAKVGPYDIQPVRARGLDALDALNTWLTKNGYPTEDPDHMRYFVENNFTFCCVRVAPAKGEASVAAKGDLAPLHLSFKSQKIYYPLLFSSRQGVFGVELFVLTEKPLDFGASRSTLQKLSWHPDTRRRNVRVQPDTFPYALHSIFKTSQVKTPLAGWHLNLLDCPQVNRGNAIAKWKEDVFLSEGPQNLVGGIFSLARNPRIAQTTLGILGTVAMLGLLAYVRRQSRPVMIPD